MPESFECIYSKTSGSIWNKICINVLWKLDVVMHHTWRPKISQNFSFSTFNFRNFSTKIETEKVCLQKYNYLYFFVFKDHFRSFSSWWLPLGKLTPPGLTVSILWNYCIFWTRLRPGEMSDVFTILQFMIYFIGIL